MPTPSHPLQSNYRSVFILALVLVLADLLLLGLHTVRVLNPALLSCAFSIESDRGVAEIFLYLQELAILLLLILAAKRLGMKGLFAWSALFLYVLLDDAFSIHENLGAHWGETVRFAPDFLDPHNFGELLVSAAAGGLLFAAIGLGYLFGGKRFRSVTHDLMLLFAGLAFFGVVFDMLHGLVQPETPLYHIFGVVEDGGEMLVISLILLYAWALWALPEARGIRLVESACRFLRQRL